MRFKLTDSYGLVSFIDNVKYWNVGESGDLCIAGGESDAEGRYFLQIVISDRKWTLFERVK